MPTLVMGDDFPKDEKIIFSKAFKAMCKFLKIEKYDCSVQLAKRYLGAPTSEGNMAYFKEENRFMVTLNSNGYSLTLGLSTFGHEMIHARQFLLGVMVDDFDMPATVWRGVPYTNTKRSGKEYFALPWEREAHGNQYKVFKAVLKALDPDEQKRVIDGITDTIWNHLTIGKVLLDNPSILR